MLRVLLAEDMHLIRGALTALLRLESDIEVVAEIASGDAILPAVLEHRPDVALIDIHLPGMSGIAATAEIRARMPECPVLIITQLDRPQLLCQALDAGAHGFMLKDAAPAELAMAIRRVAAGELVIDSGLAASAKRIKENPLSSREREVLRLAAVGNGPSEIAACLYLSKGTVRNYLGAIVTKLGARNRLDAVRIATEAGWL